LHGERSTTPKFTLEFFAGADLLKNLYDDPFIAYHIIMVMAFPISRKYEIVTCIVGLLVKEVTSIALHHRPSKRA
jgi:hypothetical protein